MEETYFAFNPWWENKTFDSGIPRQPYLKEIEKPFNRKQIDVIVGSRRVGKTVFLKQLVQKRLNSGVPPNSILYVALDHPRLSKTSLSEHLRQFRKMFMHPRDKKLYLFFDEVQESPNWEVELKSIYDLEKAKIVSTGSTSTLITRQGGKLTGRQIVTVIYPLSFEEYLLFTQKKPARAEEYRYERLFEEYLDSGGYPENVLEPSEEYLNNLLDDILFRDIVRIRNVNRPTVLRELLSILSSAVGSRTSFNKIAHILGIAVDTVKDYIGYLESAFLIKSLEKWSLSQADKIYAQKKFYFYDTGIKTLLTGRGDVGTKTENVVFLKLLKQKIPLGYYAESEREVDFVCGDFKSPEAIEVKYLSQFDWKDKRFAGIKLFLKRHPATKQVTIVSKDIEEKLQDGEVKVEVIPAWKYLKTK